MIAKDTTSIDQIGVESVGPPHHDGGLFDVLGLLRRRKELIVFGLIVGIGLSVLYYYQATPIYESDVQILVEQKDTNLPTQGTDRGGDYQNRSVDKGLLSTHIELLQSPKIVNNAVKKHRLGSLKSIARRVAEGNQTAAFYILDDLEVTKGGKGKAKDAHVLKASYRGPSPEDCAVVLSAIVESYEDFIGEMFQNTSDEAVDLITKTSQEMLQELGEKETAYREFRKTSPLLWKGDESANMHQEQLIKVESTLSEIRFKKSQTQARIKLIEEALDNDKAHDMTDLKRLALISNEDTDRLKLLLMATEEDSTSKEFLASQPVRAETARTEYDQLLKLLIEEETLLQDYGSDHPKVKTVRKQIERTKMFLTEMAAPKVEKEISKKITPDQLLAVHLDYLRHDLVEIENREKDLEAFAAKEEKAARELIVYELEGEKLRTEAERSKELYNTVLSRLREINLIRDYGGLLTEIISPVEQARRPVFPRLLLVLAMGGVLGLCFGGSLAYAVDLVDQTFRSPEEICQVLNLPILGDMPNLTARRSHKKKSKDKSGKPQIDTTVFAHHRPKSRQAEAFRGLRTALSFSMLRQGHKVIQVTSSNPRDGKTTMVTNLAVSIAQSGKRVLLVDCDFRRPRVHHMLGASDEVGLSSVIAEQIELSDAIQGTGIDNLSVLPCGPRPSNPSELLSSSKFEEFIEVVRRQFDFILIDSPPLLAVSDPAVIAPRVDGVLMAMRIVKNGRPQVMRAREILAGIGANVYGVVVNGRKQERNYGYGYGYYGGKYGYGKSYGYGYGGYGDKAGHYYEEEKSVTSMT